MSRVGVKIPLNLFLLCAMIFTLVYCVCILLVSYSFFVALWKASPWFGLLIMIFLSISPPATAVLVGTTMIQSGYRRVVNHFLEAWKDFTEEVEPGGVPAEAEV